MSLRNMTDIIIIPYDEFTKHKLMVGDDTCVDKKVKDIMKHIVSNHECFSQNYRYIPQKDENYKHKLNNYMKKNKTCFVVEKNDKYVFALMNKLTPSNYNSMVKKILASIDQVDIDVSINKIINYSKISNLYTKLICNIIKELYNNNNNMKTINVIIDNFMRDYMSHFEVNNFLQVFDSLIYDDYDEFCDHHKNASMMHNMLKTILEIIKTIDCGKSEEEYLKQMYQCHFDNILIYFENNNDHIHINMIQYQLFTHIELMLDNTNVLEVIDKNAFIVLCQNVRGTANNKLKFKVTDIMEKL
jgi:hypothetical protein